MWWRLRNCPSWGIKEDLKGPTCHFCRLFKPNEEMTLWFNLRFKYHGPCHLESWFVVVHVSPRWQLCLLLPIRRAEDLMEVVYVFIFCSPCDSVWIFVEINQSFQKWFFLSSGAVRFPFGFLFSLPFVIFLSCLLCEVPKLLVFYQRVLYEHESVKPPWTRCCMLSHQMVLCSPQTCRRTLVEALEDSSWETGFRVKDSCQVFFCPGLQNSKAASLGCQPHNVKSGFFPCTCRRCPLLVFILQNHSPK